MTLTGSDERLGVIDSIKSYLSKKPLTLPGTLLAFGIVLVEGQSSLITGLYYLAVLFGRHVTKPSEPPEWITVFGASLIILSLVLFAIPIVLPWIREVRQLIVFSSYAHIPGGPAARLLKDQGLCWVSIFDIDITHKDLTKEIQIIKATKLLERYSKKISKTREAFFLSTAHLPLVAYLACRLKDHRVCFLEINHSTRIPELLEESAHALSFDKKIRPQNYNGNDLAIAVEVSYAIQEDQLKRALGDHTPILKLGLAQPTPSAIKTENDINNLVKEFRHEIDHILNNHPNIRRVHLFYAGVTSLFFKMCQSLNSNIVPEILVYQYSRDFGGYPWALVINRKARIVQLS